MEPHPVRAPTPLESTSSEDRTKFGRAGLLEEGSARYLSEPLDPSARAQDPVQPFACLSACPAREGYGDLWFTASAVDPLGTALAMYLPVPSTGNTSHPGSLVRADGS